MRAGIRALKELIKLPTRADNSQSAREVQGTGQARSDWDPLSPDGCRAHMRAGGACPVMSSRDSEAVLAQA